MPFFPAAPCRKNPANKVKEEVVLTGTVINTGAADGFLERAAVTIGRSKTSWTSRWTMSALVCFIQDTRPLQRFLTTTATEPRFCPWVGAKRWRSVCSANNQPAGRKPWCYCATHSWWAECVYGTRTDTVHTQRRVCTVVQQTNNLHMQILNKYKWHDHACAVINFHTAALGRTPAVCTGSVSPSHRQVPSHLWPPAGKTGQKSCATCDEVTNSELNKCSCCSLFCSLNCVISFLHIKKGQIIDPSSELCCSQSQLSLFELVAAWTGVTSCRLHTERRQQPSHHQHISPHSCCVVLCARTVWPCRPFGPGFPGTPASPRSPSDPCWTHEQRNAFISVFILFSMSWCWSLVLCS